MSKENPEVRGRLGISHIINEHYIRGVPSLSCFGKCSEISMIFTDLYEICGAFV